jgi:hypothetical protein
MSSTPFGRIILVLSAFIAIIATLKLGGVAFGHHSDGRDC